MIGLRDQPLEPLVANCRIPLPCLPPYRHYNGHHEDDDPDQHAAVDPSRDAGKGAGCECVLRPPQGGGVGNK